MRLFSFFTIVGLCFSCHATPLLTAEERAAIEAALKISASKKVGSQPSQARGLFLSGILYTNKKKWTIWVNDRTLSSDGEEEIEIEPFKFVVESLNKNEVAFRSIKDGKKILVTLKPNQSYLLEKDKIVEGHWEENPCPIN